MIKSITGLVPGQPYTVQFAGVLADGTTTEWTNSYSLTPPLGSVHPAPTLPVFAYTTGNIRISWTPPTIRSDFSSYLVEVLDGSTTLGIYDVGTQDKFDFTLAMNDSLSPLPLHSPTFKIYSKTVNGSVSSSPLTATASYDAVSGFAAPTGTSIVKGVLWKWVAPTTTADIVDRYSVDVMTSAGAWASSDLVSYGDNALWVGTEGTNYYAVVRVIDVFGRTLDSAASLVVQAGSAAGADTLAPKPPTTPTISNGATGADGRSELRLNWVAPTQNTDNSALTDLAAYSLRYWTVASESGGNPTFTSSVFIDDVQQSVVIRDLLPNTAYRFEVAAFDKSGNFSTYAASTAGGTTTPAIAAPAVISGTITPSWVGQDLKFTIVDSRVPGTTIYFTGYEIDVTFSAITKTYKVGKDKVIVIPAAEFVANWPGQVPSLTEANANAFAVDSYGQRSTAKAVVTGTYAAATLGAPVLNTLTYAPNVISASWAAIPGAVSYNVVAAEGVDPNAGNVVATVPGTSTQASFAARVANSANNIRVRAVAVDIFGRTALSAASQVTPTMAAVPTAPTMSVGIDVLGATWSAYTGAYMYEVASASGTTTPTTIRATTTGLQATWGTTGQSTWGTRVRAYSHVGTVSPWGTNQNQNSATVAGADVDPPPALTTAQIATTATATPLNTYSVEVDWSAYVPAEVISKYVVEWGPVSLTTVSSFTTTSTKHTITGLTRGGSPQIIRVKPYDLSNNVASVAAGTNEKTAPVIAAATAPPTNVVGTWNGTTMRVTWSAPTPSATVLASDVVGYKVYLARSGYTTKVYETKDLSFDFTPDLNRDSGLGTAADPYCRSFPIGAITVESISDQGLSEGTATNAAPSTRTYSGQATMNAISVGVRAMSVTWSAAPGAVKYDVFNGLTPNTTVSQVVTGESASWQTSGVQNYLAKVRAYDAILTPSSLNSTNEVNANSADTVASDGTAPPALVTGPTRDAGTYDPITGYYTYDITWTNVTDTGGGTVQYYELTWKAATGAAVTQMVTPGTTTTTARIIGLLPNIAYTVEVRAVDNTGNRQASPGPNALSWTVPAGPSPVGVSTRSAAWVNNNQDVDVSFTPVTQPIDFDRYEIRFNTSTTDPGAIPRQTVAVPFVPYNNTTARTVRITSKMLQDSGLTLTGNPTIRVFVVSVNNYGTATSTTAVSTATRPSLGAPGSVAFTQSVDTVNGTWTAATGASRYRVYYGPTGNKTQFVSETTALTWRLTFVDNQNYFYSVAAVDGLTGVEGTRSAETQVETAIDAKSGKVGGWNVGTDTFYHPTDAVGLSAGGTTDPAYGNRTVRFWAGGTPASPASGKMKIYSDGSLMATQGRMGGWEMLSDDIISTGSSIQSVFLPGTLNDYIQSDETYAPVAAGYMDITLRVSVDHIAPGGTAVNRVFAGGTDNGTPGDFWSVGIDETGKLWIKVGATYVKAGSTPSVFADGEAMWIRILANRTAGTLSGIGPEALNVATNTVGFFYGGSATAREVGAGFPAWTKIDSNVAIGVDFPTTTTTLKTRIGGVPGLSMSPFIGKISDLYVRNNSTTAYVSSFRSSDINKTNNRANNITAGVNQWAFGPLATQVGITAAATSPLNANSLFQKDVSGWTATGSSTISRSLTQELFGTASMSIVTSTTNKGAFSNRIAVSGGKRYSFSGYTYDNTNTLTMVAQPLRTLDVKSKTSAGTLKTLEFTGPHGLTSATGLTLLVENVGATYDGTDPTAPFASFTILSPTEIQYTATTLTEAKTDISSLSPTPRANILLPLLTANTITLVGAGASAWSPKTSSTFTMPSNANEVMLIIRLATAGTKYVDGVRIQSGEYTDSYGYSFSATDSIRLESTGSVNIVNDYGRIDLTNRRQGDATPDVEAGTGNFLAPTLKFIGTSRDGSSTLDIPAEVTTLSDVDAVGNVSPSGNSLFMHSGALFALQGSTDGDLIQRKKRYSSLELTSNVVALAGPLTGDADPVTEARLQADKIKLNGDVTAANKVSAAHLVASGRMTIGEDEIGPLRNRGTYPDYAAFVVPGTGLVNAKSSDFVVIDGIMYISNESDANMVANGKFMHDAPVGWTYTTWDSDAVDSLYGSLTSPQGVDIVSPDISLAGPPEEIYVQAALSSVNTVTENDTFTVTFYNDADVVQGSVVSVGNGMESSTVWSNRQAFVAVPATATKFKMRFKTAAGGNTSVAKVVAKVSGKTTYASGFNVTIGTNVVGAPALTFSEQDLGRTIKIGGNAATTITGVTSDSQVFVADNATVTVSNGIGILYDRNFTTPFLQVWQSSGDIKGPPGPATEWSVSAESIDSSLPPEAIVGGASPNNTLLLKIPQGAPTFAQVTTSTPVARATGDLWFDISKAPTVPALLVSSKEFTDGIQVYNTTQSLVTAKINPNGVAQFKGRSAKLTLNTTYWESETPNAVLGTDSYQEPRYFVSSDGWVSLSGLVSSKTNGATAITFGSSAYAILTMPAGLRPMNRQIWHCMGWVNGAWATIRVDMNVAGELIVQYAKTYSSAATSVVTSVVSPATTFGWMTLTGISFEAWTTGQTFEPYV